MRDDKERLLDIIEAIEKINKHRIVQKEELESDELIQVWIIHHLQIIGEASSKLSPQFIKQHSELDWKGIRAMRNIIATSTLILI